MVVVRQSGMREGNGPGPQPLQQVWDSQAGLDQEAQEVLKPSTIAIIILHTNIFTLTIVCFPSSFVFLLI